MTFRLCWGKVVGYRKILLLWVLVNIGDLLTTLPQPEWNPLSVANLSLPLFTIFKLLLPVVIGVGLVYYNKVRVLLVLNWCLLAVVLWNVVWLVTRWFR